MGLRAWQRRQMNPLGVRKGQIYKKTDDRIASGHYGFHVRVKRVSFVGGYAEIERGWLDPFEGRFKPDVIPSGRERIKLTRFSPASHLRLVPDWQYRA